jgi:hypothetical protein
MADVIDGVKFIDGERQQNVSLTLNTRFDYNSVISHQLTMKNI